MKKIKFLEEIRKGLNKYDLTYEQYNEVYNQIVQMTDCFEDEINESISDIIKEVFEINNITAQKKKKHIITDVNILLVGLGIGIILWAEYLISFRMIFQIVLLSAIVVLIKKKKYLEVVIWGSFFVTSFFVWSLSRIVFLFIGFYLINIAFKKVFDKNLTNFKYAYVNVLGGINKKFSDEEISYLNIENTFGGCELDFRDFKFEQGDLHIDVKNLFGGCELIVNSQTEVKVVQSNNTLGGIDVSNSSTKDAKYTIYLYATNSFGGITIKR